MPRGPRLDGIGVWQHVMGRGLAKRPIFQRREDFRFFLSRLAHLVRRKLISVHSYSLMQTHFHLLIQSSQGRLSYSMMWMLNQYVRWFNRSRQRDGPLFRGRFQSKVVEGAIYWRALIRYIDSNPVRAGIVKRCADYPYGSAWHYARPKRPKWLTVTDVEREMIDSCSHGESASAAYQSHWQPQVSAELRWIVESAGAHAGPGRPRLEGLLCLGSERTSAWMKWKTLLADGPCSGTSILPPATILAAVRELGRPEKILVANRQNDQHELLCIGLLRKLSGISMQEIAQRLHTSRSRADRLMRKHVQLITQNEAYAALALKVAQQAAKRISYLLAFKAQNPAQES